MPAAVQPFPFNHQLTPQEGVDLAGYFVGVDRLRRFFLLVAAGALPVVTGVAIGGSAWRSTDGGACCVTNTGGADGRTGLVGVETGGAVVIGCNCSAFVTTEAGLDPSASSAAPGITATGADVAAAALDCVIAPLSTAATPSATGGGTVARMVADGV
jgi:hypothetical protein